jgi:hypothetical protein
MSERDVTEDDVRMEHLAEVKESVHWAYLVGVLASATVLMLVVMALLGASSS